MKEELESPVLPSSDKYSIASLLPLDNAVFAGGFSLGLMAFGAQMMRNGSKMGLSLLRKNLFITLEVTSKDRSYPWILQWLTAQGRKTQHLSVDTIMQSSSGKVSTSFSFVPGPGFHFIRYGGTFLGVQRIREQQMVDFNSGKPWEKVQFTGFGRNTKIFQNILQEAYELATIQEEGKTIVYTNWGSEWRPFGQPRTRRPLSSVILDEGVSEKLYADITEWQISGSWYRDRGIPYRRGYLLYGPPGSGKTSYIMALAGKLGYNVCVLNLAEHGLTDDRLALALSVIPPQCIVLLEDIDAAFPKRDGAKVNQAVGVGRHRYTHTSEVTFSGLLNVLDGVISTEERLVFMTTNFMNLLDSALIRPGRVDVIQKIDHASLHQIKRMFFNYFPDASESDSALFLDNLIERGKPYVPAISMAELQGYFLLHKNNMEQAIRHSGNLKSSVDVTNDVEVSASPSHPIKKPKNDNDRSSSGDSGGDAVTTCKLDDDEEKVEMRSRKVGQAKRCLTAAEVDKMVFNPQPGWDNDVKSNF